MELIFTPSDYVVQLPDSVRPLAESAGSVMMDAEQLLYLAGTLAAYPWSPGAIVVEIGAYVGRTTVFMAQVMHMLGKRVPILSIDPFERVTPDPLNPQGVYSAYLENVYASGVADICLPIVAFSQDAAPVVPDRIGVLVVDGGHQYPIVSNDLELYTPKLLPGGFVYVDDYGPSYPDVVQAVNEFFDPKAPFSVLHKSYFIVARYDPGS